MQKNTLMRILDIRKPNRPKVNEGSVADNTNAVTGFSRTVQAELLDRHVIGVDSLDVPPISFMTSLVVASYLKKNRETAVVVTDTLSQMLAVANCASMGYAVPVVLVAKAAIAADVPGRLKAKALEKASAIVFETEEQLSAYRKATQSPLNNAYIIPREIYDVPLTNSSKDNLAVQTIRPCVANELNVAIVGDFVDGALLLRIIRATNRAKSLYKIRIHAYGTGPAGQVMPAVKEAKAVGVDVTWHGEDYRFEDITSTCRAFAMCGLCLSDTEMQLISDGLQPLHTYSDDALFASLPAIAGCAETVSGKNFVEPVAEHAALWAQLLTNITKL